MDAWGGIIGAMKSSGKSMLKFRTSSVAAANLYFSPSSAAIRALDFLASGRHCQRHEPQRVPHASFHGCHWVCLFTPPLPYKANRHRSDLAEAYPNGELVDAFRQDWLTAMIKETKTNRDFQARTIETARWAREQVKRQIGGAQNVMTQT
jgi:hypothetical protein